jgi:hypothetical protein
MRGHYREIPSRRFTPEEWAEREKIGGRYRATLGAVLMVAAFPVFASGEGSGWGLPAGVACIAGGFLLAVRRPR